MSKLVAQYNKISGPNVVGDYTLTFAIQREHLEPLLDVVGQLEKKSQVIIDITPLENINSAQKVLDDSKASSRIKRMRKVYAGFDELAKKWNLPSKEIKARIKKKHKIESLEKCTDDQLLTVIDYIEKILTPLPDDSNKS